MIPQVTNIVIIEASLCKNLVTNSRLDVNAIDSASAKTQPKKGVSFVLGMFDFVKQ